MGPGGGTVSVCGPCLLTRAEDSVVSSPLSVPLCCWLGASSWRRGARTSRRGGGEAQGSPWSLLTGLEAVVFAATRFRLKPHANILIFIEPLLCLGNCFRGIGCTSE